MDNIEVLVHIGAPSGFQDDLRYRAQAEAAAQFEPCSKLRVYGPEEWLQKLVRDGESFGPTAEESTFDTSCSFSAWRPTDVVEETPAQKMTRQLFKENLGHSYLESLMKRGSPASQQAKDSTRSIIWKVTKNKAPDHNPPYKVPTIDGKVALSTIHATRTPEAPRPKTAPAGPVVAKPAAPRKRSCSESSSYESLRSLVPDSQEKGGSIAAEGWARPVGDSESRNGSAADSITQTAVNKQPAKVDRRPVKRRQTDQAVNLSQQAETPNLALLLGMSNPIASKPQRNCRVSNDSTERATASSDSTSMWPLKPGMEITYPPPPKQDPSLEAHTSAFHSIPAPPSQAEPHNHWLFSSSTSSKSSMEQSPEHDVSASLFPAISSLPTAIHAPAPLVGHARYITHLTSSLRRLATRLPVATSFRPVFVKRDINVLERGYWYLHIPVVNNSHSQLEGIRSPDDEYAARSKDKVEFWSEEVFLNFWHAFATNVRSGWSGWGVSIYRQGPKYCAQTSPSDQNAEEGTRRQERRDIVLKVSCWGEILAHIYLIMWVLSDKRTADLEMEWRDAREEVVVRMGRSGFERRRRVGIYGFKGGEGVDGIWGSLEKKK